MSQSGQDPQKIKYTLPVTERCQSHKGELGMYHKLDTNKFSRSDSLCICPAPHSNSSRAQHSSASCQWSANCHYQGCLPMQLRLQLMMQEGWRQSCLAKSASVMLTSNLWVNVGLVKGAMGTIQANCYRSGGPSDPFIAIMVHFDSYSGLMIVQSLSHLSAKPGFHLESSAHVFSCPQASVGCYHPQIAGSHCEQSGHSCWQWGVLCRPHICSLLSCPSTR